MPIVSKAEGPRHMDGPRQPAWPPPSMPGPSSLKLVPPPPPPPVHPQAAAGAAASSAAAPAAAEHVPAAAASAAPEPAPEPPAAKKRSYQELQLAAVNKYHDRRSKLIRDFNAGMVSICREFVHEIQDIADAEVERAKRIAR